MGGSIGFNGLFFCGMESEASVIRARTIKTKPRDVGREQVPEARSRHVAVIPWNTNAQAGCLPLLSLSEKLFVCLEHKCIVALFYFNSLIPKYCVIRISKCDFGISISSSQIETLMHCSPL